MNIILHGYFILILSIVIVINADDDIEAPENVEFLNGISTQRSKIKLHKIDSYLGNEHLNVWIVNENDPYDLIPFNEVMERIGKFSMYQHSETSSAAIFYHERQQFDGVIGSEHVINKLDYINGERYLYPSSLSLFRRAQSNNPSVNKKKRSINNLIDNKLYNKTDIKIRSRRNNRDIFYIEVLVIIDYSMKQNRILNHDSPDDYTPIISHVLTLFNGVDMLYSKINDPQIKINIAGIIIGDEPGSFDFLSRECLTSIEISESTNGQKIYINGLESICTHKLITTYLSKLKMNYEFFTSFDNIVFITSTPLFHVNPVTEKIGFVAGFQASVTLPIFNNNNGDISNDNDDDKVTLRLAVVVGDRYYEEYIAITHELGHAFSIYDHDDLPYEDENKNCCAFIMREDYSYCEKCLSWSDNSREILKNYFNSHDGCIYGNKPRSLHHGPHKLFDIDEQCSCYGYKSAKKQSLWKHFGVKATDICKNHLECYDDNDNINKGPIPMDGTPCTLKKVCWGRQCKSVHNAGGSRRNSNCLL